MTDDGIKGLCVSVDDLGKENAGLGQCKSIHTLDIYGTKVTIKGVQLALENLPELNDFNCNNEIQVLANLLRGPSRNNLRGLPNLSSLHNMGCWFDRIVCQRGDIELVAARCVSVNKVHINGGVIVRNRHTDVTVLELLKLEKHCQLHFEGLEGELTFNGGILPLLKHFSNSLTSLSIEFVFHSAILVNIGAIVENCPKLQTLKISFCTISPPVRSEDDPNPSKRLKKNLVLKNLKILELDECDGLTSEDLDLFLASPLLEELSISSIRLPIDESLRKAANLHQFPYLQRLNFSFLDQVTKEGIDLLMIDDNPLKMIGLFWCKLLKEEDVVEWKRVTREKNWDVAFRFN